MKSTIDTSKEDKSQNNDDPFCMPALDTQNNETASMFSLSSESSIFSNQDKHINRWITKTSSTSSTHLLKKLYFNSVDVVELSKQKRNNWTEEYDKDLLNNKNRNILIKKFGPAEMTKRMKFLADNHVY